MDDEIKTLIEDCKKREEKLSTWEHDFIVSIELYYDANKSLSPKQLNRLNAIWDKVTM